MRLSNGMTMADDHDFHGNNPLKLSFDSEVTKSNPSTIIHIGTSDR